MNRRAAGQWVVVSLMTACSGGNPLPDGGSTMDSGMPHVDSGTPADSGQPQDSGVVDAGTPDAGAGSCDAGPTVPSDTISGDRLKATWLVTDDGDRFFDKWTDSTLGVRCIFVNDSNGEPRCMPYFGATVLYTAAGCSGTDAIAIEQTLCGATSAWAVQQLAACPSPVRHMFPTTGTISAPAQYWLKVDDGTCGGPFTADPTKTYYSVGPETAPDTFVHETPTTLHTGTRYTANALVGDDGSQYPTGLYDTQLDTPCGPILSADGTLRCMTGGFQASTGLFFSDATCMTPLVQEPPGSCGGTDPKFATKYSPNESCVEQPIHIFNVGERVTDPTLYGVSTGNCSTVSTSPAEYFELGSEVDAGTFGPATRSFPQTCHRIAQAIQSAGGVSYAEQGGFYDNVEKANCQFDLGTDGRSYCFPVDGESPRDHNTMAQGMTFYTDGACTQAVELGLWQEPCYVLPPPHWIYERSNACPPVVKAYEVGAAVTTTVYEFNGFSCSGLTPTANTQLYRLGAEVSPTKFGGADLVTDP